MCSSGHQDRCVTMVVRLLVLLATVGSSIEVEVKCYNGTDSAPTSITCNSTSSQAPVTACSAFKFPNGFTSFSCDKDNKCSTVLEAANVTNSTIPQNSGGTLFCCHGDNCNKVSALPSRMCYVSGVPSQPGQNNVNTSAAILKQCPTRWCVISDPAGTGPNYGLTIAQYSCDNHNLCDTYTNETNPCATVPVIIDKYSRKICCCSKDNCNSDNSQFKPATLPPPLSPMPPNPAENIKSKEVKHMMFVGGIVAACMVGILVFIIVAIVIRRHRQKANSQLTYTYAQLTEDLAEERNQDDDHMLVG